MNLEVEQLVVDRLREWLLLKLPARVSTVNATRAAVLRAPLAGPYTVPAGASLKYHASKVEPTDLEWTTVTPFTSGSRTAAQIATDFNLDAPGIASADSTGRLVLTAAAAPTEGTDSLVVLGPDATGMMAALGFDAGGEWALRSALIAPGFKGIRDGAPQIPDFGSGFWVLLGDNASIPTTPDVRRDEYDVSIGVTIGVPIPTNSRQQGNEYLRAALRSVRECLFAEDNGRTLGNASGSGSGSTIVKVTERQALLKARSVKYAELPNQLFHRAAIELQVKVFERQA